MTDTNGTKTPPTLDGLHLEQISAETWDILERDVKGVVTLANGNLREQFLLPDPGYPEKTVKREFALDYRHLGVYAEAIEGRLAFPGPHELVLWKHVTCGYLGDSVRQVFHVPWRQAVHVLTPPQGLSADRFAPIVRIGFETPPLSVRSVEAEAFDAEIPGDLEVVFEVGGDRLKLYRPLLADERLIVRVVPVFVCIVSPDAQTRRLGDVLREPRRIALQEI